MLTLIAIPIVIILIIILLILEFVKISKLNYMTKGLEDIYSKLEDIEYNTDMIKSKLDKKN